MIRKYDSRKVCHQLPNLFLDLYPDKKDMAERFWKAAQELEYRYSVYSQITPILGSAIRDDLKKMGIVKGWSVSAEEMFISAMIHLGYTVKREVSGYTFTPYHLALDVEECKIKRAPKQPKGTQQTKEGRMYMFDIPDKYQKTAVSKRIYALREEIKEALLRRDEYIDLMEIAEIADLLGAQIPVDKKRFQSGLYIVSMMKRMGLWVDKKVGGMYLFKE